MLTPINRLGDIAKIIQRRWKTYKCRKFFKQARAAALTLQTGNKEQCKNKEISMNKIKQNKKHQKRSTAKKV